MDRVLRPSGGLSVIAPILALLLLATSAHAGGYSLRPSATTRDDVVVVYHADSAEDIATRDEYIATRNINPANVVAVASGIGSLRVTSVSQALYLSAIRDPLETWLTTNEKADSTYTLLLMPNVPLWVEDPDGETIIDDGRASVASELHLLFTNRAGAASTTGGLVPQDINEYQNELRPFSVWRGQQLGTNHIRYMTASLRAYNTFTEPSEIADGVVSLLARASGNTYGERVLIDADQDPGNGWQMASFDAFEASAVGLGLTALRDNNDLLARNVADIDFYVSNGSNAGGGNVAPFYGLIGVDNVPGTFADRSVAVNAVSNDGRSFLIGTTYGQSLTADLVAAGVAAAASAVNEPLLGYVPVPATFMDRFLVRGRSVAESFLAASPAVGWKYELVGDPLMVRISAALPTTLCLLDTCSLNTGELL